MTGLYIFIPSEPELPSLSECQLVTQVLPISSCQTLAAEGTLTGKTPGLGWSVRAELGEAQFPSVPLWTLDRSLLSALTVWIIITPPPAGPCLVNKHHPTTSSLQEPGEGGGG